MGIRSCMRGITTVAIVISWGVAMAVEVTTDTTVSLTADSNTSDDSVVARAGWRLPLSLYHAGKGLRAGQ